MVALRNQRYVDVPRPEFGDGAALLERVFRPPPVVVPGLLPVGSAILAAPPKTGKTYFALQLAIAVACGGEALGAVPVEQGDVLFVAYENNCRSLQARMRQVEPDLSLSPGRFQYLSMDVSPPRAPAALDVLTDWLIDNPAARLVVIDPLAAFRAPSGRRDAYALDYGDIHPLTELAHEHEIALLLVHHTRKMEATDYLATVSGTHGLTGAANTVMVMRRERGDHDMALFVTGHDIEETELALRRDGVRLELMGAADDYRMHQSRRAIAEAVAELGHAKPKEVYDRIAQNSPSVNLKHDQVRTYMTRMAGDGQLAAESGGVYAIPSGHVVVEDAVTPVTPVTPAGTDSNSVTDVTAGSTVLSQDGWQCDCGELAIGYMCSTCLGVESESGFATVEAGEAGI